MHINYCINNEVCQNTFKFFSNGRRSFLLFPIGGKKNQNPNQQKQQQNISSSCRILHNIEIKMSQVGKFCVYATDFEASRAQCEIH